MDSFFQIKEQGSTISREFFGGATTFLTMSYIILVNPTILSEMGMSFNGVFVATILVSVIMTCIMGLYTNTPYAIAPGMGMNAFITYTLSIDLKFHWREALAIVFLSGILHFIFMCTGMRKIFVKAIPKNLQYASCTGIGFFIAYIGIKRAGLLTFTFSKLNYIMTESETVIGNANALPALVTRITAVQIVFFVGFVVTVFLLGLEKKTGESYIALLMGIICAVFIGIPLEVTNMDDLKLLNISVVFELKEVIFSFFGRPGLLSLIENPSKLLAAFLMIFTLLASSIIDSVNTIMGIGILKGSAVFNEDDIDDFTNKKGISSKIDKVFIVNSIGSAISGLLGTSPPTTYIESITGMTVGARTGLSSLVVAMFFLLCIPFAGFFGSIPPAAIAPALIISGVYLISLVKKIDWYDFEDSAPAVITILFTTVSFSVIHGISIGILTHIIIQIALGNWKKIHPVLYAVTFIFMLEFLVSHILKI